VLSFPDWTFLLQIVLFLGLWTFLRQFLFEPNFAVFKNREERSTGALKEASQVKTEAEAMGEQYKARLTAARVSATQQMDAVYREAEAQAQSLLDVARTEAAHTISQMRESIQKEIDEARRTLEERAPDFSREIAQKLLGRSLT
jgi:F-type H+-transporting ATPase subunit b